MRDGAARATCDMTLDTPQPCRSLSPPDQSTDHKRRADDKVAKLTRKEARDQLEREFRGAKQSGELAARALFFSKPGPGPTCNQSEHQPSARRRRSGRSFLRLGPGAESRNRKPNRRPRRRGRLGPGQSRKPRKPSRKPSGKPRRRRRLGPSCSLGPLRKTPLQWRHPC